MIHMKTMSLIWGILYVMALIHIAMGVVDERPFVKIMFIGGGTCILVTGLITQWLSFRKDKAEKATK